MGGGWHCLPVRLYESQSRVVLDLGAQGQAPHSALGPYRPDCRLRDLTLRPPCPAALTMPNYPPWRLLLLLSLWGPLLRRAEVRTRGAIGLQGLLGGLGTVLRLPPLQREF